MEVVKGHIEIRGNLLKYLEAEETVEEITIIEDGWEREEKEHKRCAFCNGSEKELVGYDHLGYWLLLCEDCLEKLERWFELAKEQGDEEDKEHISIKGEGLLHLEPERTVKEITIIRNGDRSKRKKHRKCKFCWESEKELVGYTCGGGWWLICKDCLKKLRRKLKVAKGEVGEIEVFPL